MKKIIWAIVGTLCVGGCGAGTGSLDGGGDAPTTEKGDLSTGKPPADATMGGANDRGVPPSDLSPPATADLAAPKLSDLGVPDLGVPALPDMPMVLDLNVGPGLDAAPPDLTLPVGGCASNSDCRPTLEFCQKSGCDSDTLGTCVPRPGQSATFYCSPPDGGSNAASLVCGCDGQAYAYQCIANAQGVNVASKGACPLPDAGGGACKGNQDCAAMQYCNKTSCSDESGTCQPAPSYLDCTGQMGHVCGCDHQDYDSACEAAAFGASVDHLGVCPPLPSGPCNSQADCGGDSYLPLVFCRPDVCGMPGGQCTVRQALCPEIANYVCGCDSQTYLNPCFATSNAVGVAYGGPCRSGVLTACTAVQPCPDHQQCIADPRTTCSFGANCPGVCVDTSGAGCGPFEINDASANIECSSSLQECVVDQLCQGGNCGGNCVYTTGVSCNGADCPTGQLCVTSINCSGDGGCPSACVVP